MPRERERGWLCASCVDIEGFFSRSLHTVSTASSGSLHCAFSISVCVWFFAGRDVQDVKRGVEESRRTGENQAWSWLKDSLSSSAMITTLTVVVACVIPLAIPVPHNGRRRSAAPALVPSSTHLEARLPPPYLSECNWSDLMTIRFAMIRCY